MKKLITACCVILFFGSCEEDEVPSGCNLEETGYEAHIRPIIANHCAISGCHNSAPNEGINFDFSTYAGVKEGIGSFYDRINRERGDPLAMPPDNPLSPCDLYLLNVWILNGAPEY